jgi:hypothetical protein
MRRYYRLTVNAFLTVATASRLDTKQQAVSPAKHRAVDLTRGGGPYACARIGLASRLPAMPDEGRREGSLVKSAAAP